MESRRVFFVAQVIWWSLSGLIHKKKAIPKTTLQGLVVHILPNEKFGKSSSSKVPFFFWRDIYLSSQEGIPTNLTFLAKCIFSWTNKKPISTNPDGAVPCCTTSIFNQLSPIPSTHATTCRRKKWPWRLHKPPATWASELCISKNASGKMNKLAPARGYTMIHHDDVFWKEFDAFLV